MSYIPASESIGQIYGKLTVLSVYRSFGKTRAFCVCCCGVEKDVVLSSLRTGLTTSCGCVKRIGRIASHGHCKNGACTSTHNIWMGMKARCFNQKSKDYKNYGGRGITICDSWLSFDNFLADMGERPAGLQINRVDNDGNYEPDNCEWTDLNTQARNRRSKTGVKDKPRFPTFQAICIEEDIG